MGCFSSKPAVRRQPVTATTTTKTPAPPFPTPQHLPKTQTIPEPKPTPTQTLKTSPIPASNSSLLTQSPTNQHSTPNEPTIYHDLRTAHETNSAPHTPTAPQGLTKPLSHDTHITSTPATPATPVPPIPAISATDQLDQRNPLLNTEQQPSAPHHVVTATEASVEPHPVKSAITTTSTVAPQPKVDDSTTNPHEESNTPPQSIQATTSLIPEESSKLDSANLESLTAANTELLSTPTLASREHYDTVPVSDDVSAQPLPIKMEETEPDLAQNASGFVAVQEKTQTQDNALVPETDPSIEQYSAPEEREASLHLQSLDEANIEPHIEPQVEPHIATPSPVALNLTTQPPQDFIHRQSNLVNTASPIHGNNTESHEDLADTSESDHQIPVGTSEEILVTEEHNATATIENVAPEPLTATFVIDDSLTRQPKGGGIAASTFQQPHVQSSTEEPGIQYSASKESEASLHLESMGEANIDSHIDSHIEPRIATISPVAPDLPTQPPPDSIHVQSNLVNTAPPIPENHTESHEVLSHTIESDRQIPLVTSEEVLVTEEHNATATIESVIPEHLPAALVTDDSLTSQPKGDGSVTPTFQQTHVQSSAEEPGAQYSASEESEASLHLESIEEANIKPHIATLSPVASNLTTQPPPDSIHVQSNLVNTTPPNNTESHEDLADASDSDHQIPLRTSEEVLDTEEHNATATIENIVPEPLTAALVTDDSLTRQPKGDGSVATSFQQPHVQFSAEEPDTLAQPSTADTQPMPLSSENTDSLLEESPHPAVNRHDIFTSTKPEQYSSSSTSPQQHELDVTSDTQVKNVSKGAAQIAPIPVDIQSHTSSPVEVEETRRDSAQYSTSIVATQKTSHIHDEDLSPVANPTTEQDSAPEQLPASHNSSAQDLPTPPLQDSIHVQSSPVSTSHPIPASPAVSGPTLGNKNEPSQPTHPIVSEDEGMVGQHDISSKSTSVGLDGFKPAVETDVSLGSQPEVESSTGAPHEHPAVRLNSEEVIVPPHSSTARTAGTSVESGNTLSTPEESFHPVEAHLDGVTTASTDQSLNTEKSRSIVPPALDQNSSSSETSPLFGETETHTLPPVSSDGTLSHEKDTSFSRIAEEERNGTSQIKTFDEHDGSHGTRTASFVGTNEEDMGSTSTNGIDDNGTRTPSFVGTNEEDMESSASTNGIDDHGTRTPSTYEENIDFSHMESPPSTPSWRSLDSHGARAPRTIVDDTERSHATSRSTWDYTTPYRGGCDRWVMNNPPHGVGYYNFENYHGNIGTNLPRGAYHYQNNGTDGGFYIKNSDGSSYHYSPYRGGRYKEPYY